MTGLVRRRVPKWSGRLIFVAIVAVSGLGLVASGHWSNPLTVFSQFASLNNSGEREGRFAEGERPTQPEGGFESREGRGSGERGEGQNSIQWDQVGDVLFDLWFIAAVTAVVMVVGPVVGLAIKRLRGFLRRRAETPLAAAI